MTCLFTVQSNWTALLMAADEAHEEVVQYLLHCKANTEAQNKVRLCNNNTGMMN